jgi:hypothetical protein
MGFDNKQGTAEQWIKEGEHAAHWTRVVLPSISRQRGRLQ